MSPGGTVSVNGERRSLGASTLDELLDQLGLARRREGVAVAVNGVVVRRSEWSARRLRDGDEVEIVGAVQGG